MDVQGERERVRRRGIGRERERERSNECGSTTIALHEQGMYAWMQGMYAWDRVCTHGGRACIDVLDPFANPPLPSRYNICNIYRERKREREKGRDSDR